MSWSEYNSWGQRELIERIHKLEKDETHNGWANYATWRVNLEIVDSIQWVKEDFVSDEIELTLSDLAGHIQNACEQVVSNHGELETTDGAQLALDYAMAFMSDVDWYEIAKSMAETYPDWDVKL